MIIYIKFQLYLSFITILSLLRKRQTSCFYLKTTLRNDRLFGLTAIQFAFILLLYHSELFQHQTLSFNITSVFFSHLFNNSTFCSKSLQSQITYLPKMFLEALQKEKKNISYFLKKDSFGYLQQIKQCFRCSS